MDEIHVPHLVSCGLAVLPLFLQAASELNKFNGALSSVLVSDLSAMGSVAVLDGGSST